MGPKVYFSGFSPLEEGPLHPLAEKKSTNEKTINLIWILTISPSSPGRKKNQPMKKPSIWYEFWQQYLGFKTVRKLPLHLFSILGFFLFFFFHQWNIFFQTSSPLPSPPHLMSSNLKLKYDASHIFIKLLLSSNTVIWLTWDSTWLKNIRNDLSQFEFRWLKVKSAAILWN